MSSIVKLIIDKFHDGLLSLRELPQQQERHTLPAIQNIKEKVKNILLNLDNKDALSVVFKENNLEERFYQVIYKLYQLRESYQRCKPHSKIGNIQDVNFKHHHCKLSRLVNDKVPYTNNFVTFNLFSDIKTLNNIEIKYNNEVKNCTRREIYCSLLPRLLLYFSKYLSTHSTEEIFAFDTDAPPPQPFNTLINCSEIVVRDILQMIKSYSVEKLFNVKMSPLTSVFPIAKPPHNIEFLLSSVVDKKKEKKISC